MIETLIGMFLVFMIIAAIIALETTDLLSSVISIGAIGVAVSICFLLVGAPDVASAQLVVEVMTIIILIRATIRHDLITIDGDREFFGLTSTLVLIFILFVFGIKAIANLPKFGEPAFLVTPGSASKYYLLYGFRDTGAKNILTAIVFDYRAIDTFGLMCLFFAGIWGAFAIMRVQSRKIKKEETNVDNDNRQGMSLIVKNTARLIKGLIFLFGIYLTISAHFTPASGFSGGIVFACVFMLMTLAFGRDYVLKNAR